MPAVFGPDGVALVAAHRTDPAPFDVMVGQWTPGDDPEAAPAIVAPFVDAGATWWSEDLSGYRGSVDEMRERVRQGPPRVPAAATVDG